MFKKRTGKEDFVLKMILDLWVNLKNKEEITGSSNPQNQKRIELIEKRYNKMLSEVCGSYV